MKGNKKSLHKSRMRQKKMIDEKVYTPSLQIPIDISRTKIQNEKPNYSLSENDDNYQRDYVDKSA